VVREMTGSTRQDMDQRIEPLLCLPEGGVGVELGVQFGFHAMQLLEIAKPSLFYLVDAWQHDGNYDDVVTRFAGRDEVKILRMLTTEALEQFPDDSLDWVFVDANHAYLSVMEDGLGWYPKVREGGFMIFHDWQIPDTAAAIRDIINKTDLRWVAQARDIQKTVITRKRKVWGVVTNSEG